MPVYCLSDPPVSFPHIHNRKAAHFQKDTVRFLVSENLTEPKVLRDTTEYSVVGCDPAAAGLDRGKIQRVSVVIKQQTGR